MSDLSELILKVQALKQEIRERAKNEGESMIRALFQPLFDLGVTGVTWTQYTPGFNDGDPCTFGVHSLALYNPDIEPEEGYWEEDSWTISYAAKSRDEDELRKRYEPYGLTAASLLPAVDCLKAVEKVFEDAEDILELMFGNGARVFVTPDGLTSEDYDCGY